MREDRQRKAATSGAWLEMVSEASELLAWWLDEVRVLFLQTGDLFMAARASIFLSALLAWTGREEDIPLVIEDLRRTVRQAGRHGELIFALYALTNAVARGEDLEEAVGDALARLRRCERALDTNRSSGANEGAGAYERRSSMETQQSVQEQELKAERVQEELMAMEAPYQIALKAERVQEPALAVAEAPQYSAFELSINQKHPVTIELSGLQVVITLHGTEV